MIEWAKESPYLTAIIVCVTIEATFKILNRVLRTIKVLFRGWPTAPNMDADGDLVFNKQNPK